MKVKDCVPGKRITPKNKMDSGRYSYVLSARYGKDFPEDFTPYYSPRQMLELGVFEGKYMTDCRQEFPEEWYAKAKLSPRKADPSINYFGIKSRMSLREWRVRGWLIGPDNRGWFQWYCRYYMGRRIPEVDRKQIARWKSFKRHLGQVQKNTTSTKERPKQRQALLQWAHDAFVTSKDKI